MPAPGRLSPLAHRLSSSSGAFNPTLGNFATLLFHLHREARPAGGEPGS